MNKPYANDVSSVPLAKVEVLESNLYGFIILRTSLISSPRRGDIPEKLSVTTFHMDSSQCLEMARLLLDAVQSIESEQNPPTEGLSH